MPRPGEKLHQRQLIVVCPVCAAGVNHWCRDKNGKCIAPHRERSRAALLEVMRAFAPAGVEPMFPSDRLKALREATGK